MFHRDTTFGGYCLKHLVQFPCKTCAMEQAAHGRARDMPAIRLRIRPPNQMIEMSKYEAMVAQKDAEIVEKNAEIAMLNRAIGDAMDKLRASFIRKI